MSHENEHEDEHPDAHDDGRDDAQDHGGESDDDGRVPDGSLPPEPAPEDGIEPMFIRLLQQLWEAAHDERERDWSLAKLSKRSLLPMSTLRRALAQLEEEQLVHIVHGDDGRETVTLSDEGHDVCEAFFGDAFGDKA